MANIPCMNEDGNQASFIISNIDTGDVISVCASCFPLWVLTVAEAMTGINEAAASSDAAEATQGTSNGKAKRPPRPKKAPTAPAEESSAGGGEDDANTPTE